MAHGGLISEHKAVTALTHFGRATAGIALAPLAVIPATIAYTIIGILVMLLTGYNMGLDAHLGFALILGYPIAFVITAVAGPATYVILAITGLLKPWIFGVAGAFAAVALIWLLADDGLPLTVDLVGPLLYFAVCGASVAYVYGRMACSPDLKIEAQTP